jgi:hypothetical protein
MLDDLHQIRCHVFITLQNSWLHDDLLCVIEGCIQKFPDWVDNEIYAYLYYYSLRSNTKGCGGKTH